MKTYTKPWIGFLADEATKGTVCDKGWATVG